MFTEIKDTEVHDWRAAPGVFVMGLISLICGSSLGPEATLAFVGGTVGYFVWRLTDRCVAFGVEEDAATEPACVGDQPPAAGLRQEADDATGADGAPLPEELEAQPEPAATPSSDPSVAPERSLRTPARLEDGPRGDAGAAPHRAHSKRSVRFSERDRKLLILAGISGAMGAVFPSPLVPALLVVEIDSLVSDYPVVRRQGELRVTALEKMFVISASSSVSYALYGAISSNTFMKENADIPQEHVYEYRQLFSAVVLGLFSGAFGLLGFTMNYLATQNVGKLRQRLNRLGMERFGMHHPARQFGSMLVPVAGGLLWGLCAVFLPLTLGSGEPQIKFLFKNPRDMGAPFLCLLAFAKMATLSISTSSGFVGGSIFPLMFAGTCLGMASSDLNPTGPASDKWASIFFGGWPMGLAVPCMAAGLPCAFSPAIITMVVIVFLMLNLQALAVSHVFVASAVSFTTVCGLGLSQSLVLGRSALVRRAPARARKGGEGGSPSRTRPDSQE
jgi:H+/Cl- antiporter ClcA